MTRQCCTRYLDLDLHIGITGWICDERRGSHLHPLVREIPAGRLMLEERRALPAAAHPAAQTQERAQRAGVPGRGAREVALHRGESARKQLAAHSTASARAFFGLPVIVVESRVVCRLSASSWPSAVHRRAAIWP